MSTQYLVLKYIKSNCNFPPQIRWRASLILANSSIFKTKIKNKCLLTGRSRSYLRFFGLSRICFRELARNGELPFLRKASW